MDVTTETATPVLGWVGLGWFDDGRKYPPARVPDENCSIFVVAVEVWKRNHEP